MNKSESIKNIAVALVKFQEEITNPKNTANNPFFKSKYAPLPDILTLVRPLLSKHGLVALQSTGGDGSDIAITTLIMHTSGEWIESEPLVLKAEKTTAQGVGSAITYGRRYQISAVLGISSEDDDDGNHASQNGSKSEPEGKSSKNSTKAPQGQQKAPEPMGGAEYNGADLEHCAGCKEKLLPAVKIYCQNNKKIFQGLNYCKKCQDEIKEQQIPA